MSKRLLSTGEGWTNMCSISRHCVTVSCKMDYLIAGYCFLSVIVMHTYVSSMDMHSINDLWIFHVRKDDTNGTDKFLQQATKSYKLNLSISSLTLNMTRSVHKNYEAFCDILTKTKVVALLYSPNFGKQLEFTLAAKHLALPVLNAMANSLEDKHEENRLPIHLHPNWEDSLTKTLEIIQMWTPTARAVIFNAETYEEITNANIYTNKFVDDIKFYRIATHLLLKKRTQMIAEALAEIRNLKIRILVVYLGQKDLEEVLALGTMMQMTGTEYKWILPYTRTTPSQIPFPSNTFVSQLKNSNRFANMLSDAVDLVEHSFNSYNKLQGKTNVPSVNCFEKVDPSFANEFYRLMVGKSFWGKTGYLGFDKRGNRINAEYQVINLNNSLESKTPSVSLLTIMPKELRAVTAVSPPFVYLTELVHKQGMCGTGLVCNIKKDNLTERFCCKGYAIDMLDLLQRDLATNIELHIVKDGKYGSFDEKTKRWDGMIGELLRNEADFAIADLTITDDRSRVVDFTHPFMEIGLGFLVKVEREGVTHGIWAFLQPVATQLWIATCLAISLMGILFWSMERIAFWIAGKFSSQKNREKYEMQQKILERFSFAASIHYSWSTVVRTRDKVTMPSNTSAKVGAITLALCFLVFITTYTAQLAAFLVAEVHVTTITDLQDNKLLNPSAELKIATVKGSSALKLFRKSPEPRFINMWKHMMGNNVPTIDIGVDRLKAGAIDVFVADYNTLVYIAAQDPDCSLRVIGQPVFKSGYGIASQKNSSWTRVLTQKILQYEKFDTFLELAHRWMKTSCDTDEESGISTNFNAFHRMSAYDVSGMLVVLAIGVLASWLLLAAECHYKKRKP